MDEPRERLDFDRLSRLAHQDPVAFERLRRQAIEDAIARAPHKQQQRLRCLQWRIDRIRDMSDTPLAACISISNLMWRSVAGENGFLDALNDSERLLSSSRSSAVILPFPRR